MPNETLANQLDDIKIMVDQIAARNMVDATATFNNIMGQRIAAGLDLRRNEISTRMYGVEEPASADTEVTQDEEE